MTDSDRDHPLFRATQQQVAEFVGVDRTTIRNWTKQGMPYRPGNRGESGEYDAAIVSTWHASLLDKNRFKLPRMTPCQQLAVSRALSDRCPTNSAEEKLSRSEFPDCFRKMASEHFSSASIEQAIAYATAVFDMTFNAS